MPVDDLLDRVHSFSRRFLPAGSSVAIAVSGGGDSTALLHVLLALRERLEIERMGIAHVNHGLRGRESDADERFVAEMARTAGLPFHPRRLHGRSLESAGMEAWARRERYRFLSELRSEHGYAFAATGHTADDQAETVLMRLERGCDLKGLTGIHAVRDDGVVRPLMTVQGHELRDWLVLRGLAYREDSSNRDERFFRNRLRHGALARISAQDPEFVLRVAQSALQAQEKVRAMQPSINKWICEHVVKLPNGRIAFDKDAVRDAWFPRQAVAEVLRHESIPFGRRHIEAIVRCAGKPRATVLLPGNWRWEVESGNAELCGPLSTTGTGAPVWFGMNVPGTTPCGDWGTIEARICSPSEVRGRLRSPDNMMVYLDAARVEEELVARTCSPGEAFHPYGRPSSVRVGQFLKKQGIGKSCRDSMVVVAEQKGEIIWIPGVRTSARYAVDERTRAILELKCMRQGCRKGVC